MVTHQHFYSSVWGRENKSTGGAHCTHDECMTTLTFHELTDLADPQSADSALIPTIHELVLQQNLRSMGHTDLVTPLEARRQSLLGSEYTTRLSFVAESGGEVVGMLHMSLPQKDNRSLVYVDTVAVDDNVEILDALFTLADEVARKNDRSILSTWEPHRGEPEAGDPNALEAPTGVGRIDASEPLPALYLKHGWKLEQTERYSVLPLPAPSDLLARLHAKALAKAGAEYEIVHWQDHTPEEFLEGHASLQRAMSTDVPHGDLEIEETVYDADRILYFEKRIAEEDRGYVLFAARHIPTGDLAGFTRIEYAKAYQEPCFQEETLVKKEHRGHALGMLVKTAAIAELAVVRPGVKRLHMWNAGENSYMLNINVALGFEKRGIESAWQKKLA